jgi:ureidoacrylate peracid hydrolase
MHRIAIRREIVERVLARRGRLHLFDALRPEETALLVIDMQNTFLAPGAPAEVPAARDIVPAVNRLAAALRPLGVRIVWVSHAARRRGDGTDWDGFFRHFVAAEMRERTLASLSEGAEGQRLWPGLELAADDSHVTKNRYSALIAGASPLEAMLRGEGRRNLLIAGTKTDVCCEATARDAMMLDFNVVMVSDCLAALSDEEHRDALETVIQQFGDVMSSDEVVAALARGAGRGPVARKEEARG